MNLAEKQNDFKSEARSKVETLLEQRELAMERVQKLIHELGSAFEESETCKREIITLARTITKHQIGIVSSFKVDVVDRLIAGLMSAHGLTRVLKVALNCLNNNKSEINLIENIQAHHRNVLGYLNK